MNASLTAVTWVLDMSIAPPACAELLQAAGPGSESALAHSTCASEGLFCSRTLRLQDT